MQDSHILFVVVEPLEPVGQFMFGQINFESLFLVVLL